MMMMMMMIIIIILLLTIIYYNNNYHYYYLPQKKQINKERRKNNWHPGWWAYPYIIHSNVLMLGSFCIGSLVAETDYICIIPFNYMQKVCLKKLS